MKFIKSNILKATKEKSKYNLLVTGGAGFLGRSVLEQVFENNSPLAIGNVSVLDIKDVAPEFKDKISHIRGDIRDFDEVLKACENIDVVIHTAAIVDWGVRSDEEVLGVNVKGTENIIRACREKNISYLVHTSSLDAVYSGKPLIGIDETQPYPEIHETTYCKSKYLSEKVLMEANGEELKTCVLRPSDIYGERDPYHIGSLINMAKSGFYIRLGNGTSQCQHVYVGNMANALLQAAASLIQGNKNVEGNVYFITDGKGANFFKFFDQIVIGAGYRIWPKNLWLPRPIAYFLASISEFIAILVRPIKRYAPKFSKFAVTYTCTDFTFTSQKAIRDFDYKIKYSTAEALKRTISFYKKEKEGNR